MIIKIFNGDCELILKGILVSSELICNPDETELNHYLVKIYQPSEFVRCNSFPNHSDK